MFEVWINICKYWCSDFLLIPLNTVSTLTFLAISTVNLVSSRCTFHNCLISFAQYYLTNTYWIRHIVDIWYLVTIQWVNYSKAVNYSNAINFALHVFHSRFLSLSLCQSSPEFFALVQFVLHYSGPISTVPFQVTKQMPWLHLLVRQHFHDWVLLLKLKRTFYFDSSFHSPPLPTAHF